MLSIDQRKSSTAKVIPNLLPCRIHHDGPVGSADSYWMPSIADPGEEQLMLPQPVLKSLLTISADAKKTAYFRGRQLHGKVVKVPDGYRGVVIEKKDAPEPAGRAKDEPEVVDVDAEDEDLPLGALEAKAEFEEMVIWGHESVAEASADPYVRGVDEWMKLAEQVCSNVIVIYSSFSG